jgi:hypothetical protein
MSKEVIIDIVSGVEGRSLCINETRVAGNKAWGGGTVVDSFNTTKDRVLEALDIKLPQWIPCSERLPIEEYKNDKNIRGETAIYPVLVTMKHIVSEENKECIFVHEAWFFEYRGNLGFYSSDLEKINAIAWQPLPEPYKEV